MSTAVRAPTAEAQPYVDEVDGVLYYTCPECRKELEELKELEAPRKAGEAARAPVRWASTRR